MVRRAALLTFAPFYFWAIGHVFQLITERPFLLCLALTLLGSMTISAVITFFAVQMTAEKSHRGFSLASIFALTIPIALYLAAFRILYQRVPGPLEIGAQVVLFAVGACAAICHTALLLLMTEAFVAVTLRFSRQKV